MLSLAAACTHKHKQALHKSPGIHKIHTYTNVHSIYDDDADDDDEINGKRPDNLSEYNFQPFHIHMPS